MEENKKMIELQEVSVHYPRGVEDALKKISLGVGKGEFVFIVGSSGSGKSTLIKTLLGEVEAKSGKVSVAAKDLRRLKRKELPFYRRKIGVVFQEFRLLEDRNIFENVALSQRVVGVHPKRIRKNVMEMLRIVGLEQKAKAFPKELSGGEQQRVAIARAMVNRPELLLADEPTGNLDPKNSWEIMELLEQVNRLGTTIVVVTHNNEIVNKMKKRVISLQKGMVTSDELQGGYVQ